MSKWLPVALLDYSCPVFRVILRRGLRHVTSFVSPPDGRLYSKSRQPCRIATAAFQRGRVTSPSLEAPSCVTEPREGHCFAPRLCSPSQDSPHSTGSSTTVCEQATGSSYRRTRLSSPELDSALSVFAYPRHLASSLAYHPSKCVNGYQAVMLLC